MVAAEDLKFSDLKSRVGSSPTPGTGNDMSEWVRSVSLNFAHMQETCYK